MKNKKMALKLKTETVKVLGGNDLRGVAGGGIHGTGTPSGLCPKDSVNCPKPN